MREAEKDIAGEAVQGTFHVEGLLDFLHDSAQEGHLVDLLQVLGSFNAHAGPYQGVLGTVLEKVALDGGTTSLHLEELLLGIVGGGEDVGGDTGTLILDVKGHKEVGIGHEHRDEGEHVGLTGRYAAGSGQLGHGSCGRLHVNVHGHGLLSLSQLLVEVCVEDAFTGALLHEGDGIGVGYYSLAVSQQQQFLFVEAEHGFHLALRVVLYVIVTLGFLYLFIDLDFVLKEGLESCGIGHLSHHTHLSLLGDEEIEGGFDVEAGLLDQVELLHNLLGGIEALQEFLNAEVVLLQEFIGGYTSQDAGILGYGTAVGIALAA